MRLIYGYNFPWNNLGNESPRESTFIMRQNWFLLNTKIVQDTLLNPRRQLCCLFWLMVYAFNALLSKALPGGMKGWVWRYMKHGGEEWEKKPPVKHDDPTHKSLHEAFSNRRAFSLRTKKNFSALEWNTVECSYKVGKCQEGLKFHHQLHPS